MKYVMIHVQKVKYKIVMQKKFYKMKFLKENVIFVKKDLY